MHYKQYIPFGTLALSLVLSACGQPLALRGQNRPGGIPTATRGLEVKGAASAGPAPMAATAGQPPANGGLAATALPAPPAAQAPAAQATQAPVPPPPSAVTPTVNPVLANVQLPSPVELQARWRQIQTDRTPLDKPRPYVSPAYQVVWWFDPLFGQIVPIGQLRGEFAVQATFRIRGEWLGALELPYHVNQQYGFTVPDAIVKRMKNAGVGEWAEVFIYQTQDIQPK